MDPALGGVGRRFATHRRISLSDTDASARLRLDAVARYLQDVASEDWLDAGFDHDSHVWVVRRTELAILEAFRPEDLVAVETWCSGVAASSAARRYSIRGKAGGRIEAESIWTHLDHGLRPTRLDHRFHAVYGSSAAGRRPSTKFTLPDLRRGRRETRWPLRSTDVDRLGHVNNVAYWNALEEVWRDRLDVRARVTIEYRRPIDLGEEVVLGTAEDLAWFVVGGEVRSAARLDPEGAREAKQLA